jgi:hypothetical protein
MKFEKKPAYNSGIDAVNEPRCKVSADGSMYQQLGGVWDLAILLQLVQEGGAQVAGHHNDAVAEEGLYAYTGLALETNAGIRSQIKGLQVFTTIDTANCLFAIKEELGQSFSK